MPTCQVCKTSLPGFQSRGRKRYYCSKNCKQRAYRARKKKVLPRKRSKRPESKLPTCFVCERPLLLPRTGRKPKYCSANCKQKDYRKRRFVMREKYQKALRNNLLRLNHKSVEWHTPMEYISAVREVFGGQIELDPASSEKANETVQALRFFDRATNGLEQEWKGRIYLNPPHDRTYTITPWIHKLLQEVKQGHVESAILLVDAATSASWFQPLYNFPLCFVEGRISFQNGEGKTAGSPIGGSVFVYFGDQQDKFSTVFRRFGKVLFLSAPVTHTPYTRYT